LPKKDKVISFRTDEAHHKKLNSVVYHKNLNKKKWLEDVITTSDAETLLSLNKQEKWVKIPASEYSQLLDTQWKKHAKYICDRIEEHVKSKGTDVTFDTLFFETKVFHAMNGIKILRFDDGEYEIIQVTNGIGKGWIKFETQLIVEMLERTTQYYLISKRFDDEKITIKIKKCE
jgi:hypothetical protein